MLIKRVIFCGDFQILWINFQLMVSKSCCPQMSLTHLPSESVMLLLFWVYFRRCRCRGHCFMIMRQNMRSMVIWRRGEISQTVTMLPTMVKPQSSTSLFIGRQGGRGGLRWPQMLWCGGWTVGFSQSIFSHGFQKIENSNSSFLIGLPFYPVTGTQKKQKAWNKIET